MDLRQLTKDLETAFNTKDIEAIASFFTEDSTFIGMSGEEVKGVQNIKMAFEEFLPSLVEFQEKAICQDDEQQRVVSETDCIIELDGIRFVWACVDILDWDEGKIVRKSTLAKADVPKLTPL